MLSLAFQRRYGVQAITMGAEFTGRKRIL